MAGTGRAARVAGAAAGMSAHIQPAALLPLMLAASAAARGRGASTAHRHRSVGFEPRSPALHHQPPSRRAVAPGLEQRATPPAAEDDGRHRAAVDSATPAPTRRQRPVRVRCSPPMARLPPRTGRALPGSPQPPTHCAHAEQRQARHDRMSRGARRSPWRCGATAPAPPPPRRVQHLRHHVRRPRLRPSRGAGSHPAEPPALRRSACR